MNMRPPVAQVTPALAVGLATAWIVLSLFLLPAGSGPLRSLPVGPVADLVTGPVVAALEPSVRPPAAPSHALDPKPTTLAPEPTASVSHHRIAARSTETRTVRRAIRQRFVPVHPAPPTSTPVSVAATPVSVAAAPQAATTPQAHGKGKALGPGRAHSSRGQSKPSQSPPEPGLGRSTEEHGHGARPPGPPAAGDGDNGHGGGGHGGGGR